MAPREGGGIRSPRQTAAIYRGFLAGRLPETTSVRSWIEAVIRNGNWRFDDPEGLSQEVQLRLIRMARAGRIRQPRAFEKLVYRVAKTTCVDAYRRQRQRALHESASDEVAWFAEPRSAEDPVQALQDRERRGLLRGVWQQLPKECRELWRLVYAESLPAEQVARRLGLTAGAVRVRVHRSLRRARVIRDELSNEPTARPAPARH